MFICWVLFVITLFSTIFAGEKVVLFNDTSAWYHWGCTGTSIALKEQILGLGFDINAVPVNVTYSLKEVPLFQDFNDLDKFYRFSEANKDTIKTIQDAAIVVINGEGTIHDLRAAPRALLYLAHISKFFLNKHVEIINHSAYPKDSPILSADFLRNFSFEKEEIDSELKEARKIYKRIYGELDFVAIREPFSQAEMENIGISSTLSFDCLPLYIRDHYQNQKEVNEKCLVIGGSVAFSESGAEYLCRYLEKMVQSGFQVKVLIGAAAFPSQDDRLFVHFLEKHCKAPFELIVASSMEEWLDTINHATLFVSGRFHHSIAAFCLNTPFIALNSNTHKVHAICSYLEQAPPLLFSDPELLNKLWSRTLVTLSSGTVNNDKKIEEICKLAKENFNGLKAIAKESVNG